ncbi:MAG: exopolysaccharide biosynthesis predicted pyruvyl transferase EpsI [Saprospiraceae bacterium]|jgi:exopolysaccharide biosynthesis predicted pyruvyltransferase EpsI
MGDKIINFKSYFDELAESIKNEAEENQIFFMPNPGNWGDGLINYSTFDFFEYYNIKFEILAPKKRKYYYRLKNLLNIKSNSILIYGGGGGWNAFWKFPLIKLQDHGVMNLFRKVIVLPSTYETYINDEKMVYYSRDSYNSMVNNPSSTFCPDMAFFLYNRDFSKYSTNEHKKGFFYRTDRESANRIIIPKDNHDLSLDGDYLDHYHNFFKEIGKYEVIHTDRLHICIAGFLLKKEVYFYQGGYFKNEAIYKSILSSFENIHFE